MIERKCGTCKYYEPAPIWRKGWCRHPLLYAPHQSHLVNEDDLDCDRGMGNYWEPAEDLPRDLDPSIALRSALGSPEREQEATRFRQSEGGRMDQQHTNPGTPPEPEDEEYGEYGAPPPFRSRQTSGGHPFGMEQQYTYRTEERYWPDYLRIALPVLGVILMLALAWFWLNSLLGRNDNLAKVTPPVSTTTAVPAVITGSTATPAKATTPIPLTTAVPTGTAQATQATGAAQGIQNGSKVVVANTGGSGVNLRAAPSTSGEVVKTLPEGTKLTVVGNSVNADGHVWWPVKTDSGDSGYVVGDYLKPAS